MRRLVLLTIAVTALLAAAAASSASKPATLCVGKEPGCYSSLQPAVDAAGDGATIQVRAGTWAGGVTVTKSLTLTGAGNAVVSGGGPVLTIGSTTSTPTVRISNLTFTGGVTHGNPQAPSCGPDVPRCGPGYPSATALGGGIEAFPGTSVTISNSVVTGNVATPALSVPSVKAVCPGNVPCPASFGDAAGIDNWGTMTLENTTVSDNHASAVQSNGGGIVAESGSSLTLRNSTVTGNTAAAVAPSGRFASGGGIFVDGDATLVVENSRVNGNGASLTNSLAHPYPNQDGNDDQANAIGGGIQLADGATASIRNSHLDGNTVTVDAPLGEPFGADAAICACGEVSLTIENSTVTGNSVTVNVAIDGARRPERAGGARGRLRHHDPQHEDHRQHDHRHYAERRRSDAWRGRLLHRRGGHDREQPDQRQHRHGDEPGRGGHGAGRGDREQQPADADERPDPRQPRGRERGDRLGPGRRRLERRALRPAGLLDRVREHRR